MQRNVKYFFAATAVLLSSLLLVSCSINGEQSSLPASALPPGHSMPAYTPGPSSSPISPASQNIDPDRPPPKEFVPEAPETLWVEPEMRTLQLAAPEIKATISTFDGNGYSLKNFTLFDEVTSSLHSAADLFFVVNNTLYYSDSAGIYRMRENVCEIAGSDRDGIFLIVPDERVQKIIGRYEDVPEQTSLIHFNPVNGTDLPIIRNVQAAIVDESHRVLFYVTPQPENDRFGYRYLIKRRELPWGQETVVFTDEYVPSEAFPGSREGSSILAEAYNVAFKVEFYLEDDVIGAQLEYPFPSEYPYERHVWFDVNGRVIADSEVEEVLFAGDYHTTGVYQYSYSHYVSEEPVPLGPYQVRMIANGSGFSSSDFLVVHDGEELYWQWDYYGDGVLQAGDLLYCSTAIYNGAFSYQLPFGGDILKINGEIYYFVSSGDSTSSGMTLYRATGNQENPVSFKPLGRFEAEESDGFCLGFDYGSSVYVAGDYVIVLGTLDNIMVIDTRTDKVVGVGTEEVNGFVS